MAAGTGVLKRVPARLIFIVIGTAFLLAGVGFQLLRPRVEERVRARLEGEARKLGLSATVGEVHLAPWLSLVLRDLTIEDPGRLRLTTREVVLRPRLSLRGLVGRAVGVVVSGAAVVLPAGLRLEVQPSAWVVESFPPELRLRRLRAKEELALAVTRNPRGFRLRVHASNAHLSELLRVQAHGCPLLHLGTVDVEAQLDKDEAGTVRVTLGGRTRGLALAPLATIGGPPCPAASLGAPTDVEAELAAMVQPQTGSLRADRLRLAANGAEATGRLAVEGGVSDPRVDLQFDVARLDLARLLRTAGIELAGEDLGSAAFSARVTGRLLDPAALAVAQRLDFTPPARPLAALVRLRGPFVHRATASDGRTTEIRVSPESPDFLPLADVPPLFVRTLLLAEDANFYGHRGIDLSELPVAMATDLARGAFVRGASTISQQLAKNLFLSRQKTLSRKLEEASLALLLDSALGKQRVLEIYLNVIEWGPGLYGLRPAARHYFGKEPQALTPRQMAFLVSLIPAPIKYQRSFPDGSPTPFLEGLMTTLLAKLQSVGALSEAEHGAALAEPLGLKGAPAQPEAPPAPTGASPSS